MPMNPELASNSIKICVQFYFRIRKLSSESLLLVSSTIQSAKTFDIFYKKAAFSFHFTNS